MFRNVRSRKLRRRLVSRKKTLRNDSKFVYPFRSARQRKCDHAELDFLFKKRPFLFCKERRCSIRLRCCSHLNLKQNKKVKFVLFLTVIEIGWSFCRNKNAGDFFDCQIFVAVELVVQSYFYAFYNSDFWSFDFERFERLFRVFFEKGTSFLGKSKQQSE